MTEGTQNRISRPLLQAFAPLHRLAMGMAWGLMFGGLVCLMTVTLLLKGGEVIGPNLALLGQYFWGYSVTWSGAVIGLLWGFGTGFVLGWLFAVIRNTVFWLWLTLIRSRAEMEQYGDFLDHM